MKQGNDIYEELKSMGSPLADLPRTLPYMVPPGYFDAQPGAINEIIGASEADEYVPEISKAMPYQVPAQYFEEFASALTATIAAEGITAHLPRQTPYTAPTGYFEALPAQILSAVSGSEQRVMRRFSIARPVRWAAAAVLLVAIGLVSYQFIFNQQPALQDSLLASVPNNEIQDYLQLAYRIDPNNIVSNTDLNSMQVDNKDIIEYLNENGWDVVD